MLYQILTQTENKCSRIEDESAPASLTAGLPSSHLEEMSDADFADLILFLSDITHTLQAFMVDVYPRSINAFYRVLLIE